MQKMAGRGSDLLLFLNLLPFVKLLLFIVELCQRQSNFDPQWVSFTLPLTFIPF